MAAGHTDHRVTVALRPFAERDTAWLDMWLPSDANSGATEPVPGGFRLSERIRRERQLRVRIIVRDDEDVGVLIYRVNAPRRGAAMIELVATQAAYARRGSGMMAAAIVEQELRSSGVRAVYAPATAQHGIAVYFWIRLGYRPLLQAEWPCATPGVIWFRRDLDSQ